MTHISLRDFERTNALRPLILADWSYHRRTRRQRMREVVAWLVVGLPLTALSSVIVLLWILLAIGRAVSGG